MRDDTVHPGGHRTPRHRCWVVAATTLAALLLAGCGPSGPPDPLSASTVEARTAQVQRMRAALTEVTDSLDGTVLGESSVDECYEGQRNWKVDTGYDHRCSLLAGTLIGVDGDVRATMLDVDVALRALRWQAPDGEWPGQLVDEYWDLRADESSDGTVRLHLLPGPYSVRRDDLRLRFDYGDTADDRGREQLDGAQRSTLWCCGPPSFERRRLIDVDQVARAARQEHLILVTVEGHYLER